MEDYLFQVFKARQDLLSNACPGESKCCEEGGRIFDRRQYEGQDLPVLRVCHGSEEWGEPECEALITKPGHNPPHLTPAIVSAYELTEIKRAIYNWPDALSPVEWSCIRAFERAEARVKRQLDDEQEEERRTAKIMAELDQARRR